MTAVAAAIVTGVVTGLISAMGTVGALKVHIQYLREALVNHDHRLRHLERTRPIAGRAPGHVHDDPDALVRQNEL